MNGIDFVEGVGGLADRYDGFILDVWGVLHDGIRPYPGVVDALERLNAAGKRISLLSNAPGRADIVVQRVEQIGIPRRLYGPVVSSGEEVWQHLRSRMDPFYATLGRRCLWLGGGYEGGMFDEQTLDRAKSAAEADFILNVGPDNIDEQATRLLPMLTEAAARDLPMVCANPDLVVMFGARRIVCAGQVAKVYEGLGGRVSWHGKPFRSVYETSLRLLGVDDRRRVLAVGDSLRTDIAGAAGMGLDSLFIMGGIHGRDFGRPGPVAANVLDVIGDGPRPTYVAAELRW